ncbi:MAG: hypothetical protein V3S14_11030 [Anaerolineae bacterium]
MPWQAKNLVSDFQCQMMKEKGHVNSNRRCSHIVAYNRDDRGVAEANAREVEQLSREIVDLLDRLERRVARI